MATGGIDVSQHIECAVCFEVYRNPHSLRCLHTFCKDCIDKLAKHGKVTCPECREVCSASNVRQDFKTQALIDSHNARQQEVPGQAGSLCGMCGEQGMTVVSHCASCDHVMCARCQGIHAKLKTTRSHPVKSLKELLAKARTPYKDAIKKLKCAKMYFDNSSKNITLTISRINQDKAAKIKQVDEHIEKLRACIHQKINSTYTNAKKMLNDTQGTYNKNSSAIETNIGFLMEIVNNDDLSTIQAMEGELKGILDESQKLSRTNPLEFTVFTSPVTLQFKDVHPDTLVDVVVAEALRNPKQISKDFHKIATQKYKKVGNVKTQYLVQRMRMINSHLYCAAYDDIHIYNTDLTLIRKISNDKLRCVTSVAQFEQTGDLIVTCGLDGEGLHQLTSEGNYVKNIKLDGKFSDVCCNSRKVYALDYNQCKIRVFTEIIDNVWSETVGEQIQLMYSNKDSFDKMLVTEDSVFVSSWNSNCVYEYSLSSRQCMRQLGREGLSGLGELYHPRICDIDTQGSIMVCDWGNKRVQVCKGGGDGGGEERWSCLTLPGLKGRPADAVVGRGGHTLWVASYGKKEIIQYKI